MFVILNTIYYICKTIYCIVYLIFNIMTKSKIALTIENGSKLVFRPNSEFYKSVNIRRKRWGQIYRGERSPLMSEIIEIANYFQIPPQNFVG
jgi:hypothetical protein